MQISENPGAVEIGASDVCPVTLVGVGLLHCKKVTLQLVARGMQQKMMLIYTRTKQQEEQAFSTVASSLIDAPMYSSCFRSARSAFVVLREPQRTDVADIIGT
jgi:uncharacterized membrane protein